MKFINYRWIYCCLAMLLFVFFSKDASSFAVSGIGICLYSVIPSLFPLIYFSSVLTDSISSPNATKLRLVSKIFNIPQGCEFLVLLGFLSGYPVGAQNVANAYQAGLIKKSEARRMLILCNNAGPSFIFGIVAQQFSKTVIGWIIWIILIFASWITSIIIPKTEYRISAPSPPRRQPAQALQAAMKSVGIICGWVILFRILLGFADMWLLKYLPPETHVFLLGFVELANGCVALNNISCNFDRFITATTLLSLGGICVLMQTATVANSLGIKGYFQGKLLHGCICCILCFLAQPILFPGALQRKHIFIAITALVTAIINSVYFKRTKEWSRFLNKDIVYC